MHKYIASKPQTVYHLFLLCLPLGLQILLVCCVIHVVQDNQDDVLFYCNMGLLFSLSIFGFLGYLWRFIDDPILGRFSFDTEGITFYTLRRKITFQYDECVEIGFTRWIAGGVVTNHRYIYYIYFSKKTLTDEQRTFLFWERSKKKRGKRQMPLYQSEYVLFQYRPDVFSEFIKHIPEHYKKELVLAEKQLDLKAYEKFLHR